LESSIPLAEILMLEGAYKRAKAHLNIAQTCTPGEQFAISKMRWLLCATEARLSWYEKSAVPTFSDVPPQDQRDAMRLSLFVRSGSAESARAPREQMEIEPPREFSADGAAPAPLRDICDLSAPGFEALALDGRFFWIAPEHISQIQFRPITRPRDLLRHKVETPLTVGREGILFLVAQSCDSFANDAEQVAKTNNWKKVAGGVTRGRGQRTYLVSEEDRGILDIEHMTRKTV
jgi:type VI secretion system protein ImpE